MLLALLCGGFAAVLRPRLAGARPAAQSALWAVFVGAGAADPVLRRVPGRRRGAAASLPRAQPSQRGRLAAGGGGARRPDPARRSTRCHHPAAVDQRCCPWRVRIQQVCRSTFGVNTLYQGSAVLRLHRGGGAGGDRDRAAGRRAPTARRCAARAWPPLLAAAVIAGAAAAGADRARRLRGPRADPRPGSRWRCVVGAACTAPHARVAGAVLAVVAAGAVRLCRREDRRQRHLPAPRLARGGRRARQLTSERAIVAYDGQFATGPLSIYLRGVPWSGPGRVGRPAGPTGRCLRAGPGRDQRQYAENAAAAAHG